MFPRPFILVYEVFCQKKKKIRSVTYNVSILFSSIIKLVIMLDSLKITSIFDTFVIFACYSDQMILTMAQSQRNCCSVRRELKWSQIIFIQKVHRQDRLSFKYPIISGMCCRVKCSLLTTQGSSGADVSLLFYLEISFKVDLISFFNVDSLIWDWLDYF